MKLDPALPEPVEEGLVEIDGEGYYAIPDMDRMAPFLMNVVSDGDRWMFLSSNGGLTAGRGDAAGAVFPYETDDRLHEAGGRTGPVTVVRVRSDDGVLYWHPMTGTSRLSFRRLYKSVVGNSVIIEEVNPTVGLSFRYRWTSTDQFGFVRTATLTSTRDEPVNVELIDGLVNILPHGLDPSIYLPMGNLTNAYKRSEVIDDETRLAVYSLESLVVDRMDPAEALRGSVVWSVGLDGASVTMDSDALTAFENDDTTDATPLVTGRPGAYLLACSVDLAPGEEMVWHIVSDVGIDQAGVSRLRQDLRSAGDIAADIDVSARRSTDALVKIMARADGLQWTGDSVSTAHHFANVTYNVMRGGIPLHGYLVQVADFAGFLEARNTPVATASRAWLDSLPAMIERSELQAGVEARDDLDLLRLSHEYLPFSFSRRHGDPSRPWNAFSIRVTDADGEPLIHYEGNWRDIFQNWEAMCMSFPGYLPDIISVFVNASTPDGFNPYRVSSEGIEWETPEPEDPWSNIGYWGDHQIVYLLRLLEASARYVPGAIERLLGVARFSYADVPYRIVPYDELLLDPKATILYDDKAAARTAARVEEVGGDGKLVWSIDGSVHMITLVEKLIVPALAKLSNFVPDGGIWMNTQRPEWNDANNALVGHGLSMVTLYQLRRYLEHLRTLVEGSAISDIAMSSEVAEWLEAVTHILRMADVEPAASEIDRQRRALMDGLGEAFSDYRARIYDSGFTGVRPTTSTAVVELCDVAISHLDATIRANERPDGLYHSYNLLRISPGGSTASVERLFEMLEGQVAVLESGVLRPDEKADLMDILFASAMYREDQSSFMLYPARQVPSFLDKNVIPAEDIDGNPLLAGLVEAGESQVVVVDADGRFRFNADITNLGDLEARLDRVADDVEWGDLVAVHRETALRIYDTVFHHRAYTGRSGSMHGYEGIGSIYWQMVAKLLVALQESVLEAADAGDYPSELDRLVDSYWRVRSGLGYNKTAIEHGAIPTDPYSHTPAHAGAQQPGMSGLVKEELLVRPLELGVRVEAGEILIDPVILRRSELLDGSTTWDILDLSLERSAIALAPNSLGLTFCQVPIVVSVVAQEPSIEVVFSDGTVNRQSGLRLDRRISSMIFARSGDVTQVRAFLPLSAL